MEPPLSFLWTPHDSFEAPAQSDMLLLENNVAVGPAHAQHVLILKRGGGVFAYSGGQLVFSAKDNSDPRRNGRTYAIRAAWYLIEPFGRSVLVVTSVLAFTGLWLGLLAFGRSGQRPWICGHDYRRRRCHRLVVRSHIRCDLFDPAWGRFRQHRIGCDLVFGSFGIPECTAGI